MASKASALMYGLGTWVSGAFDVVVMMGVFIYVWVAIYNQPIIASPRKQQSISTSETK